MNMNINEVKIVIPEGMEIDTENSTFECIKFKPKKIVTYDDIVDELSNKFDIQYYTDANGFIWRRSVGDNCCKDANNAYFKRQLEKVLAFNKLLTVAKYLNGNYELDDDNRIPKHFLCLSTDGDIVVTVGYTFSYGSPVFKTKELAKRAVEILGEDTIKLALTNNY